MKAELVENVSEYRYSSYSEYENGGKIVDTEFALSILPKNEFLIFNNAVNDDKCLDIGDLKFRLSDNDASEVIKKISKCENATEFQLLHSEKRDYYIRKLKQKGMSIRQISRLTGISKGIIERIQ